MKDYLKLNLFQKLTKEGMFDDKDAQIIIQWFVANEYRLPVVVVGAGFSLNAVDDNERPFKGIPLWKDVIRMFEEDMGLQKGLYDAPQLAEYYKEAIGEAGYKNRLLHLFPDDKMNPGPPHKALYRYPLKAVITTNLFDTLLDDRSSGWIKVVQDKDLSIVRPDGDSVQLIYFHGHREQPDTWTFTRSEYEDLLKTRPLIVTRVRQLLTQYPVLILGYSLADPDFHQIYRQISLDMKLAQPYGLALLVKEPLPAEKQHWNRLGINIVTLRASRNEIRQKLQDFLRITPNSKEPFIDGNELLKDVEQQKPMAKRLETVKDVFGDEKRTECINFADYPEATFDLWLSVVKGEFSQQEWTDIQHPRISSSRSEPVTGHQVQEFSKNLKILDPRRFSNWDFITRVVDRLLSKRSDLRLFIADWLCLAMENGISARSRDADDPASLANLVSWAWTDLVRRPVDEKSSPDPTILSKAENLVRESYGIAKKYRRTEIIEYLEQDSRAFEFLVFENDEIADKRPEKNPLRQAMITAFHHAMNGEHETAVQVYDNAAKLARSEENLFLEWLAVRGAFYYYQVNRHGDFSTDAILRKYKRTLRDLIKTPIIEQWLRTVERREQALFMEKIEQWQSKERKRKFGSDSMTWSSTTHYYWRSFRDLESEYAPPTMLARYIKPLIDSETFDSEEELHYRLKFNVKDTDKWLRELGHESEPSILSQRFDRDKKLVQVITNPPETKTEWLSRLEAIKQIETIIPSTSLQQVRHFLKECQKHCGLHVNTYSGDATLFHNYADSWTAFVKLLDGQEALETLSEFEQSLSPGKLDTEHFCRCLSKLPWYRWRKETGSFMRDGVDFLLNTHGRLTTRDGSSVADEGLLWSLCLLLSGPNLQRIGGDRRKKVTQIAKLTLEKKRQGWLWETDRAAFLLLFLTGDKRSYTTFGKRVFAKVKNELQKHSNSFSRFNALEMGCAVIADLAEDGTINVTPGELFELVWEKVEGQKEDILRYIQKNPHHAVSFVRFLVQTVKNNLGGKIRKARNFLWMILLSGNSGLVHVGDILHPRYWASRWNDFVGRLLEATGGNRGIDSLNHLIQAIDIWQPSKRNIRQGLHPDLHFLMDLAYLSVAHENALVANHAAYSVVQHARTIEDDQASRAITAMKVIASDSRSIVRMAAAYGAASLKTSARSKRIREAAMVLGKKLENDPYALVFREYHFGLIDG